MLHDSDTKPDLIDHSAISSEYPWLSPRHLRYLRETGRLNYYMLAGKAWFDRRDLDAYVASRRVARRSK
jgi:hypothetical protein